MVRTADRSADEYSVEPFQNVAAPTGVAANDTYRPTGAPPVLTASVIVGVPALVMKKL
jgi:hypothetical protein